MQLTVIIPTLNEAAHLPGCIAAVRERTAGPVPQIIVADCGSQDDTITLARQCGVPVVSGAWVSDRSAACNAGAQAAEADALLFLHADSLVPQGYDALIRAALADPGVVGGAFEFKLDGPEWRLRIVELINRLRYRIRGRFYGDQGIFVRHLTFKHLGGFPDQGILEDAHFCGLLRRAGKTRLIRTPMPTSPRRFYNSGILTTLARDILIVLTDLTGLNPQRFAPAYRQDNTCRGPSQAYPAAWAMDPAPESVTIPTWRAETPA
ncbi:MAG: TIGR04283 family arsenosugar biosynthesis glycosyltransferase [Phycisphaerae bacterium]